jgi:hypothetical protein
MSAERGRARLRSSLHPIAFALFPVLSFFSANRGRLLLGDRTLPALLIFDLAVAAIALVVSMALLRNLRKAALVTSIFLVAFFAYGPVRAMLEGAAKVTEPSAGLNFFLMAAVVFAPIVFGLIVRRWTDKRLARASRVFSYIAVILIVMPLATIVLYSFTKKAEPATPRPTKGPARAAERRPASELPDIYYIVLDSYPRADITKGILGYDDSAFVEGLRRRGFYVADHSNSNYAHTFLSLPSTLHMRYLDDLPRRLGKGSTDNTVPLLMIEDNAVVPVMKDLGYRFANVGSGWFQTDKNDFADVPIKTEGSRLSYGPFSFGLDETSIVYLQNTAIRPLVEGRIRSSLQLTVLNAFDAVGAIAKMPEPTFSFVHITIPHPPFLFDEKGNWLDSTAIEASGDVYLDREHYVDQLAFTGRRALQAIDSILARSSKPPIIVLAGDHGSTTRLGHPDVWGPPERMGVDAVRERMGILNAYHFPDKDYDALYPTITPVNSFRLIFRQYFGLDYPALPDNSFYSHYQAFFRYYDVTSLVRDDELPAWAR